MKELKVWVQSILPVVYDDSLSYYEVLCKVVAKINEIVGFVNDQLKEYIENALSKLVADLFYDEENEAIVINLEVNE